MCMHQKTAAQYEHWKWIRLKGEIVKSIDAVENVSTPLSKINRKTKQKINKDIENLTTRILNIEGYWRS